MCNYVYHLHVLAFHKCLNCVYTVAKHLVYACVKKRIIVIVHYNVWTLSTSVGYTLFIVEPESKETNLDA